MAERQDQQLVRAVLEYRTAVHAVDLSRQPDGMLKVNEEPAYARMLLRMGRAQNDVAAKDINVNLPQRQQPKKDAPDGR